MSSNDIARKPRLALMGEFSAGKSTLLNMLLAEQSLPVRITATSVPPVWISYGEPAAARVTHDDVQEELPVGEIAETSLEDAKYIRLWLKADILELCDLFDLPGISDPNMSRDVLMAVFDEVDSVIWCTHATQAWRQSEAAVWEELSPRTQGHNIMAVTQFDKITSERDQGRLLSRLRREAGDLFEAIFPLSLLEATHADDRAVFEESGASAFCEHLVESLMTRDTEEGVDDGDSETPPETVDAVDDPNRVVPKRVSRPKSKQSADRARPPADQSSQILAEFKSAEA